VEPPEVMIRPMRPDDVAEAERLSDTAFRVLEGSPMGVGRSPERQLMWHARTAHLLETDPAGCWVAEREHELVGFATSFRRDLVWFLSTYAVLPHLQGMGLGRTLLETAMKHGDGCLRAMLSASDDPKAFRRYRQAGFTMHPQMYLRGRVDRSAIPAISHVREGSDADVHLLDSLDRARRDAAHGPDHEVLLRQFRLVVTDRSTGQGYAYLDAHGEVALLAATDRRTAARLLWEAVASAPEDTEWTLPHVTAANHWAIDVGLAARLDVHTSGFLALRGMKPPAPYIHHGALL
jgi:GNAT superfamily N-acetyltransferase